jgi:hypothetical protein
VRRAAAHSLINDAGPRRVCTNAMLVVIKLDSNPEPPWRVANQHADVCVDDPVSG